MSTVFIVTHKYGEGHIEGIFSSQALADEFVAKKCQTTHGDRPETADEYYVEQYCVDEYCGFVLKHAFVVAVDEATGVELRRWVDDVPDMVPADELVGEVHYLGNGVSAESFVGFEEALALAQKEQPRLYANHLKMLEERQRPGAPQPNAYPMAFNVPGAT